MQPETLWLYGAAGLYLLATLWAVGAAFSGRGGSRPAIVFLVCALAVHSVAIVLRWQRLDHGPYVNLFEILSSNVWSLHLAVLLASLALPRIRGGLAAILPVLHVLVLWMLTAPATDGEAPVTYATIWLAVHVWLGKVFLGCVVVALALSLVVLLRRLRGGRGFPAMPGNGALDELAYRLVLIAFVFQSLMLVAGAIWAQDAWGRYWAWDPLETWAFVTWLAVAAYLHLRAVRRPSPAAGALIVIGIFVIAFSTFFGMPFVSTAPHKGAV